VYIDYLPVINQDTPVCGLLPMSKNNKWIYRDSLFDDNGNFVEIKMDTLRIVEAKKSDADGKTWWKFISNRNKGLLNLYLVSSDSTLYFPTVSFGSYGAGNWLEIPKNNYLKGFWGLTDVPYGILDFTKLNTTVTVPAGGFINCIKNRRDASFGPNNYNAIYGYGISETTYKPGIGIIKHQTNKANYANSPNGYNSNPLIMYGIKTMVSELVEYTIEQ
jgi:hypothetical protein